MSASGATEQEIEAISAALLKSRGVERIIDLKTFLTGPDQLLVVARVSVPLDKQVREVAAIINQAKVYARAAIERVSEIYIEADVWVDPNDVAPPTEEIVLLSSD